MSDELTVPDELKGNVFITKLSELYGWGRKYSLWPMFFGVACCAIEFMAASASRYDTCLLYTSPSPRDRTRSRMPSSA